MKKATFLLFFCLVLIVGLAQLVEAPPKVAATTGGQLVIQPSDINYFRNGYDHNFEFHVYNSTGHPVKTPGGSCDFHVYNRSGSHIINTILSSDASGEDFEYYQNASSSLIMKMPGTYSYIINCNTTSQYGREFGYAANTFVLTPSGQEPPSDLFPTAFIMLLPMLFGLILIWGAGLLDPKVHTSLRIFLYFCSIMTVFMSLYYANQIVAEFYFSNTVIDSLGMDAYYFGLMLFIMLSYFILYLFYVGFKKSAQDDSELKPL